MNFNVFRSTFANMQIFNRYIKEEATGKNFAQISSAVCSDPAENRLCTLQPLCGICSAILFPKGCIQCSYISLFRKGIQCVASVSYYSGYHVIKILISCNETETNQSETE